MTFVAPESAPLNASRIPSIVVLGADALLAALPATPVQLAHACVLAGYQSVVPASWGDELIAVASLRAVAQHGQLPAIQCSCPHVAHRLLAVGTDLRPFLLSLVAPPVVLARYLRAASAPGKLRITYVGRCPGAADESIDARLTPEELLANFSDRQIILDEQPRVYDSVIPPDRRRYRSQPGGLPTPEMLWSAAADGTTHARRLVELHGDDLPVELAQHLLGGKPVLIDCAPRLGCVCSGATAGIDPAEARERVIALEPPRAPSPVIDEQLIIDAALPLPASPRSAIDVVAPAAPPATGASPSDGTSMSEEHPRGPRHEEIRTHSPLGSSSDVGSGGLGPKSRRLSPSRGIARPAAGSLPTARDPGGRQLPRTYVAHRRSPSRSPRTTPASGVPITSVDAGTGQRGAGPSMPNGEPTVSDASPNLDAFRREPQPQTAGALEDGHGPSYVAVVAQQSVSESVVPPRAHQPAAVHNEPSVENPRYAERAVALPVTPRSDAPSRHEPASQISGERPLMQVLTVGLLISMIVLVSAVIGVLVDRWVTRR
jgi:hypothetical protein